MAKPQNEEIRELKKISAELKQIQVNTGSTWYAFFRGMLQGGGAILGSIAAVVLVGWVLGVLGVVPGFQDIATYIGSIANRFQR